MTKEERDTLFYAEIADEELARIRDMFCLQCFIGCRISDLYKLTKDNIIGDFIQYIPGKTKGESQHVVSVPLIQKAKEILARYDMPDRTLMPYTQGQKYNVNLKKLFKSQNFDRLVVRLNPLTRKDEIVPLHKMASSHMARRTFVGILHKTEKNEVIASMSGHTANSKAFARYYKVDDESKLSAIKSLE